MVMRFDKPLLSSGISERSTRRSSTRNVLFFLLVAVVACSMVLSWVGNASTVTRSMMIDDSFSIQIQTAIERPKSVSLDTGGGKQNGRRKPSKNFTVTLDEKRNQNINNIMGKKTRSEQFTMNLNKPFAVFVPSRQQQQEHQENVDTVDHNTHEIAGLSCDDHGGPSNEIAAEMVYWQDVPRDSEYITPFAKAAKSPKYLTFEPDEGGFNNIRMAMETAVAMAVATGRTLVLPPKQKMYLLNKSKNKNGFTFHDFFPMGSIDKEYEFLEIISMNEFLKREGVTGGLKNNKSGKVSFPPGNQTDWNLNIKPLFAWLRTVVTAPIWDPDECVVGIPSNAGRGSGTSVYSHMSSEFEHNPSKYHGSPTPVDGSPKDRLEEILGPREKMCTYDSEHQNAKILHFMGDNKSGARLLTHFYTYIFFEDWRTDLLVKRFVRDHLRYNDIIQCGAARVVNAVRNKARENGDPHGIFDSFHIRRGDFQYAETRITAEQIYENVKDVLVENSTVFIATDERDKSFFDPLRKHYQLYFLDDFRHLIEGVDTNYYGMLDQRIASRGSVFVGAYLSTFTGYINRMRGYHSQKGRDPGYEQGILNSYHYAGLGEEFGAKLLLRSYEAIDSPMWAREFPVSWRDIDHDIQVAGVDMS